MVALCPQADPWGGPISSVIVLSSPPDPATKASSLCARFCRGARCCQSRSLPRCACAAPRLAGSFGQLVTAPLFRLGLETGIEAAIGAGSQSKGQDHDDRNQQHSPDASHLRRDQERQEEVLAADRRSVGHSDGKGFNLRLDYLPLNDAEIVVRVISDDVQTEANAG